MCTSRTIFMLVFSSVVFPLYSKLFDIPILATNQYGANLGYNNSTIKTNGEYLIIQRLIKSQAIVFDVGASRGDWTSAVLDTIPHVGKIYAFEPIPTVFQLLKHTMTGKPVEAFNLALSNRQGLHEFFYYSQNLQFSEMSTFYERPILFNTLGIKPERIDVYCATLDHFCFERNIRLIDFLKIDTEGAEFIVLQGALELLKKHAIKFIQFEYGGTYKDAHSKLENTISLLTQQGYVIFRICADGLIYIDQWDDKLENYKYSNYLAAICEYVQPYAPINNL